METIVNATSLVSPFGANRKVTNSTIPTVISHRPITALLGHSTGQRINQPQADDQIKKPPNTAPQLLPEPPMITITQIKKV